MKIKMRVLHYSPAGNTEKIAAAIAKAQGANTDRIPPAYPVESERLLFIGVELKGSSIEKPVLDLCKDLNPSRVKNVAIFVVGSGGFSAINEIMQIVTSKGINIAGVPLECEIKGGLFKKGSVSDEDIKGAVNWADKIVDSLVGQ